MSETENKVDVWAYWRAALAGQKQEISVEHPQAGYYKMRYGKTAPWQPVAIYYKDGAMLCRVGEQYADPLKIWSWCANKPVTRDDAMVAFKTGSWPGDVPQAQDRTEPGPREAVIGDNSGDLSLAEEIRQAIEGTVTYGKKFSEDFTFLRMQAKEQDLPVDLDALKPRADEGGNRMTLLRELRAKNEAKREELVRPHLDAQRKINAEYKPLTEGCDEVLKTLGAVLGVYMDMVDARAAEAAAAAASAENKRRLAEHEAKGPLAEVEPLPEMVAPEKPKTQIAGQRGRKIGLKTVTEYTVTDYALALEHCRNHPTVIEAVTKVATLMSKAGAVVPGVTKSEKKVAS